MTIATITNEPWEKERNKIDRNQPQAWPVTEINMIMWGQRNTKRRSLRAIEMTWNAQNMTEKKRQDDNDVV